MTLTEAFIFKSGGQLSETEATTSLSFYGLNGSDIFDINNGTQRCAFYKALLAYLSQNGVGVKSISEGGYSISYDAEFKYRALESLARESQCNELIELYSFSPKVSNKSFLW